MAYRLVVFDFDGTLADSLAHAVAIFRRLAPTLGLKPFDDVDAARAMTARQLMRKLGVSFFRLPRVVRAFQAEAAVGAENLKLQPGIAEMISALHARGLRLGILSSNREDNIRACLRANGVEAYFDRMPAKVNRVLAEANRVTSGDANLLADQVQPGHHFADRVLDLNPGIHF